MSRLGSPCVVSAIDAIRGESSVNIVDRYLAHLRFRNFAEKTIRRRRETLDQFERFIAPTPILETTEADCIEFVGVKRAASTRHAYRSDLRSFYGWLVDKRLIAESPAAKMPKIKVPRGLPRPIDWDVASATLTHGTIRIRRMVGLALFAGLRCFEIARLQAEDVWLHAEDPVIVVRDGKGGKDRTVPMHPELVALMDGLYASGPIFEGVSGPTVQPASVSAAIKRHLVRSGVAATPHQYRHSFGTEVARQSRGNMLLTSWLMGHSSMNTTRGYVQLTGGIGADVVQCLGERRAA